MGHTCPRGLVGGLIKKGGGAGCICDARFRLVCSSAVSWTGGCVGGCGCACASAVREEDAGGQCGALVSRWLDPDGFGHRGSTLDLLVHVVRSSRG